MKRNFVQLIEVLTVGFPFCAFKILVGMICLSRAWAAPLGWLLIALGAIDFAINAVNAVPLALGRPAITGVCLSHLLARRLRPDRPAWHELATSLDVLLSFFLVAIVIGFGLFPSLPPAGLRVWNIAVVLNVLGAGVGRIFSSLDSLRATAR